MVKDENEDISKKTDEPELVDDKTSKEDVQIDVNQPHKSQTLLVVLAIMVSILLAGAIYAVVRFGVMRHRLNLEFRSGNVMVFGRQVRPRLYMRSMFVQRSLF